MKVKEENENAGLKLNYEKMKIMASGPIASWHIVGIRRETMTDSFWSPISLQLVTTAIKLNDACSLEEKLRQT